MASPKEPREEWRDSWIESLLQSATKQEDHSRRIDRAMNQITESEDGAVASRAQSPWVRRSVLRWGIVAVAASILVVMYFALDSQQTRAIAAVKRSLGSAAEPIARSYKLQIAHRTPEGAMRRSRAPSTRQIDGDLFVKGIDRFALQLPGPVFGANLWLGNDGAEPWVVPPLGPVRKGQGLVLSQWLRAQGELDTPYLHVSSLLTRMAKGYRLRMLPDESVARSGGATEVCQHILAERESTGRPRWPDVIELWCDREGVAVLVEARWTLAEDEFGAQSMTVRLDDTKPSLDDSWFSAEGHHAADRPTIRVE